MRLVTPGRSHNLWGGIFTNVTAPAWWDAAVAETSVTVSTNTGCLEKQVFAGVCMSSRYNTPSSATAWSTRDTISRLTMREVNMDWNS